MMSADGHPHRSSQAQPQAGCAQVCDFGLALTVEDATRSVRSDKRGTAQYAAPELLRNGSLCRSSDVYSFGMIAWHLVSAGSRDADMTDAQICYQARPVGSGQHEEIPALCM